jgi:alcohol dehydrogenase class IV
VPERTAIVLGALGLAASSDPAKVLETAHRWCVWLGCKMKLSDHGVPPGDLPHMADEAFAIRRLLDNNPREISRDEILEIYKAAY